MYLFFFFNPGRLLHSRSHPLFLTYLGVICNCSRGTRRRQGQPWKCRSAQLPSAVPFHLTTPCPAPRVQPLQLLHLWMSQMPKESGSLHAQVPFLECSPHFFLWATSVYPSSCCVKHHSPWDIFLSNTSPTPSQLLLGQDPQFHCHRPHF